MLETIQVDLAITSIIILTLTAIWIGARFRMDRGPVGTYPLPSTGFKECVPISNKNDNCLDRSTSVTRSSDSIISRRSCARFDEEIQSIVSSNRNSPAELVRLITDLCVKNYDAATALYFKGRDMKVLSSVSVNTEMFLNLCSSCIRVGSPHFVFKYFSEMDDFSINRDLSFYNSIIKILTFKKCYKINLSISDMFLNLANPNRDNLTDMEHLKSVYSCMLYSSIETREFWRSSKFFKQIVRSGIAPSERDFINIAKAIIDREDWVNGFKLLISTQVADLSSLSLLLKAILKRDPSCVSQLIRICHTSASLCAVLSTLVNENFLDEYIDSASRRLISESSLVDRDTIAQLVQVIDTLGYHEKTRMNLEYIVDKFLDIALSATFVRLGEPLVELLNTILRFIIKKDSPGLLTKIRNRIVPFFKRSMLVIGQDTSYHCLPDLSTYSFLFQSVSRCSISDVMEIYRMFESQSDVGLIVGNTELFNDCLSAIACQVSPAASRYVWTVAKGIVDDMLSMGVYPSSQTCGLLVSVLIKLAAVAVPDDHEYYFEQCFDLLTVTMSKEYDLVPDMKLFVQAVTGAIVQRRMRWVNRLFSAMVDQHKRNRAQKKRESEDEFGVVFSDCEEEGNDTDSISVETVNYLLKVAAKIDSSVDIFIMLVELVLINKLSMRIDAVLKSLKPLSSKSKERLFGILKKYKYKVSRSNLC